MEDLVGEIRQENERHLNWKGRNRTVSIWHDMIFYIESIKKTIRTYKWVYQGCRLLEQYTKINYVYSNEQKPMKLRKFNLQATKEWNA